MVFEDVFFESRARRLALIPLGDLLPFSTMLRQVSGNATRKVIQTTPERMLRNPKFHLQPSFSERTPPRMGPMLSPAFGLA
jgi:hypothetical protein